MGVNGLWQVLQPCARPTNLATLNRKRLAVDASIWIYQFLKAVRDKEGNALRNSHVVGFFRRICKLLWFGILPVFVFDGGAPTLKRATLQARRHRREGRRDDAVRTAGKLLAVQMQRLAEEEQDKRRKRTQAAAEKDMGATATAAADSAGAGDDDNDGVVAGEVLPSADKIVYAEETHMSQQERIKSRKFTKQDAYHLPDLEHGSIDGMGRPEDPRIMSIEELESYARQFHDGEDINLYDFSKIDFDGEFFKSLPPPDRYNILNAARIRSRLRLGLSKEQLDAMFPDRMAFSRFQIERVKERNHLTQRLMLEVGMTGLDLTMGINGRVAGERGREYILVKNDGAEGGWALGVVSREKDIGEVHKPIDVDALQFSYRGDGDERADDEWEDEDVEFEDVPIEGLNRLPKLPSRPAAAVTGHTDDEPQQPQHDAGNDDSMFVPSYDPVVDPSLAEDAANTATLSADEDEDLSRAIAMSLQNQHGVGASEDDEGLQDEEDVDRPAPQWTQKAAETVRPIFGSSGKMVAHVVNNRANAAVSASTTAATKARDDVYAYGKDDEDSSDSELDIRAAMAKAAKKKKATPAVAQQQQQPVLSPPIQPQTKNPFGGPLPFEKLNWQTSIFEKKPTAPPVAAKPKPLFTQQIAADISSPFAVSAKTAAATTKAATAAANAGESAAFEVDSEDEFGGGFEREPSHSLNSTRKPQAEGEEEDGGAEEKEGSMSDDGLEKDADAPRPLPPWMSHDTDIRSAVRQQQQYDAEINAKDREMALEEAKIWQQRQEPRVVEIDSSSDDGSDIEIIDAPPPQQTNPNTTIDIAETGKETASVDEPPAPAPVSSQPEPVSAPVVEDGVDKSDEAPPEITETRSSSPEMEFEDVEIPEQPAFVEEQVLTEQPKAIEEELVEAEEGVMKREELDDVLFAGDGNGGEAEEPFDISDPEDEELLVQMAEEVEEHARFASELNHRAAEQSQQAYEQELKALRNQQKKDRRDADEVTQVMVSECQALLRLFGIPYITAPMEAEAQCAELVSLGLVDGIVTDDSDTFLFGGTRVYKNMFNGNKFVECYISSDLEREMSLTREKLIAIAQLLGSDYTDGLPGVGPVTAMEIISEFPGTDGLEQFRAWWQDVQSHGRPKEADADSAFRRKFRKSQGTKLFLPLSFPNPAVADAYLKPEVDRSAEPFQWGVPDLDGLRSFLMATIGWSQERTDEVLVPVIRDMNRRETEGTQSNITRFFTGAVGAGARMTEAQVREQQEKQQRLQQQQLASIPEEFAPRHTPRNKNTTSSRRLAAAVSKLKASSTAAGATASVMRASPKPAGVPSRRKRKGRASTAALEEEENGDAEEETGSTGGDGEGEDDEYSEEPPERRPAKRRSRKKTST
ncbi:DNA repair protein rad2 [Sporothrix curviconia]|uniref:DNA repair protein rad2 n=1 Tax=Sporothrix curviconia TaxID=1260050 RepID=A0ABP0CGU6_9PEZI